MLLCTWLIVALVTWPCQPGCESWSCEPVQTLLSSWAARVVAHVLLLHVACIRSVMTMAKVERE